MTANADQITYWNEVAGAKWVANQQRIDRLMAPLTDALLAAAQAKPGEHVLDVGCGCGDLSLRLAPALGPTGRIDAIDISAPMLAHAQARAARMPPGTHAPIAWREADAMTQHFAPTTDLLTSRFGVMFFDDRPRAFRNLHAALKPDGRFAFLTWRRRSVTEWMQSPLDWIAPVLPTPDEVPGEIGPFGLADEVTSLAMFEAAGFCDVRATPVDRPLMMGETAEDACQMLMDTGPAAALVREAEPAAREAAAQLLRAELAKREGPGGVVLNGACWLYTGRA